MKHNILFSLIALLLLIPSSFAALGDPTAFGNSTTTTVRVGGTIGIINATGNITTFSYFVGLYNLVTDNLGYTRFNGSTITSNETKINQTIDLRIQLVNSSPILIALAANISINTAGIADLATNDTALRSATTGLATNLSTTNTALSLVATNLSTHTSALVNLSANISALNTTIGILNSSLINLASNVSTLNTALSGAVSNGSLTLTTVNLIATNLSTANSALSSIASNVSALNNTIALLNSSILGIASNLSTTNVALVGDAGNLSTVLSSTNGVASNLSTTKISLLNVSANLSALSSLLAANITAGSANITGAGTANRLTKWSAASVLTNANISDNGENVSILSSVFTTGNTTTSDTFIGMYNWVVLTGGRFLSFNKTSLVWNETAHNLTVDERIVPIAGNVSTVVAVANGVSTNLSTIVTSLSGVASNLSTALASIASVASNLSTTVAAVLGVSSNLSITTAAVSNVASNVSAHTSALTGLATNVTQTQSSIPFTNNSIAITTKSGYPKETNMTGGNITGMTCMFHSSGGSVCGNATCMVLASPNGLTIMESCN